MTNSPATVAMTMKRRSGIMAEYLVLLVDRVQVFVRQDSLQELD